MAHGFVFIDEELWDPLLALTFDGRVGRAH